MLDAPSPRKPLSPPPTHTPHHHHHLAMQVKCGDSEVDALLEAKIGEFVAFVERQRAGDVSQLRLSFYEKRRRQAGWFGMAGDERLYWEQW